ncbi:MAG: alpha/beta hydrolase [Gammaproteobacteria bacterium]|nr:alpha/beta hydrolase [Gammaproteobacteria bacterium]
MNYHTNHSVKRPAAAGFAALLLLLNMSATEAQDVERAPDHADVTYATVGQQPLKLDLYLPDAVGAASPETTAYPPPLVVWLHGGAWRFGSKANPPLRFLEAGFALASVDFRPSTDAPFPAMLHDVKAAIRFLRANAGRYGYAPGPMAVAGASSGGHLAALAAVTNGDAALEGGVGDHAGVSSAVQAAVVYFGASNLTTILDQSTPFGLDVRRPALELLLGAAPDAAADVARLASPVFHVDAEDPPMYLLHGDQDLQMPINQAHELHGAYKAAGLDAALDVVHGAGHGGDAFYDDQHWAPTAEFLRRVLVAAPTHGEGS